MVLGLSVQIPIMSKVLFWDSEHYNLRMTDRQDYLHGASGIYRALIIVELFPQNNLGKSGMVGMVLVVGIPLIKSKNF